MKQETGQVEEQLETQKKPEPDTEEMGWQLVAAGWRQRSKHLWVSPAKRYFIGVRDAWLKLKENE